MKGSSCPSQSNKDWFISIWNEREQETRQSRKPKIQRIPQLLRGNESNKECYDPIVVSIGPYHHGEEELQLMEKLKTKSARQFLGERKDDLFDNFAAISSAARACYAEGSTDNFSDEEFTRMMFLDGCFILDFINCSYYGGNYSKMYMNTQHCAYVLRDLFLLENQLPLIVLEELIKLRYKDHENHKQMMEIFVKGQISAPDHQDNPPFIECIRNTLFRKSASSQQQTGKDTPSQQQNDAGKPRHLLDLLWIELVGKDIQSYPQTATNDSASQIQNREYTFRSVEELKKAGITCNKSKTSSLKDVHFRTHRFSGSLSLPPIAIDDFTKSTFLNLIAYETCPDAFVDYAVTSYICLMDSLIDKTEDVRELRSKNILLNRLGSDEQVADLFNQLAKDLLSDPQAYGETTSEIEKHCRNKKNIWMTEVWHTHFSSPWTLVAFVAAVFIILLTVVQTYFSIFPLDNEKGTNSMPPPTSKSSILP